MLGTELAMRSARAASAIVASSVPSQVLHCDTSADCYYLRQHVQVYKPDVAVTLASIVFCEFVHLHLSGHVDLYCSLSAVIGAG